MSTTDTVLSQAKSLFGAGQFDKARTLFEQILREEPQHASAHYYYGLILATGGNDDEGIAHIRRAIESDVTEPKVWYNLGRLLHGKGRYAEARTCYIEEVRRNPLYVNALNNLADIEYKFGNLSSTEDYCRKACAAAPDFYMAYNNLGNALKDQARYDEAIEAYRAAIDHHPAFVAGHSNILLCMCYDSRIAFSQLCEEHRTRGRYFAAGPKTPLSVDTAPGRRLRIGYISADFRTHSVGYFFEPILRNLDRDKFEVFCYSDAANPDPVTLRMRGMAAAWRDIARMDNHHAVADLIASDKIDILVDLAGHSGNNRLPVFGYRPAPVQVTHIGYPCTTGHPEIGYRISDAWVDTPDQDGMYTEKLVRLDKGFLCYNPPADAPAVEETLPAMRNGHVTFGSFNNLAKIGAEAISLWARVLKSVDGSRLMLKSKPLGHEDMRNAICEKFSSHGIDKSRLILKGHSASVREHLACYGEIDIALDTPHYNGTTTTCEALWMGVPVIALQGKHHISRVSCSILARAGLTGLVAESERLYIAIALFLAKNPDKLLSLRKSLRMAIAGSPLCDGPGYAACLAEAYLQMWKSYLSGE